MERAIIWLRSSTDKQQSSVEEQRNDLTKAAIKDGLKEDELKFIGRAGASAIKMNDLYQKEVNELLDTIQSNQLIEVVYVWEMSRLARNELAFYTLKDCLVKNKIQLICLKPSIKLFDDDGKINTAAEIQMNLLVTLAKQEMELKAERFARAKTQMKAEKKVTTGRPMFGYYKAKDKTIKINEDEAKIIEEIFYTYLFENISLRNLYQRYVEKGIFKPSAHNTARMRKFFVHLGYSGRCKEMPYPPIISEEIQDNVIAKMKINASRAKTDHKYIWYAKGLLTYGENDKKKKLSAMICRGQYALCKYNNYKVTASVNINAVDSIIWFCAIKYKAVQLASKLIDRQESITEDIKEREERISTITKLKEDVTNKLSLAFKQLINGKVNEEIYTKIQNELQSELNNYNKSITLLNNEIASLNMMRNAVDDDISLDTKVDNIQDIKSDTERKKIINQVIGEVELDIQEDKTAYIMVTPKYRFRFGLALPHHFTIKEVKKRIQINEVWRRTDGKMIETPFSGEYLKRVVTKNGKRVYQPSE